MGILMSRAVAELRGTWYALSGSVKLVFNLPSPFPPFHSAENSEGDMHSNVNFRASLPSSATFFENAFTDGGL